MTNLKIVSFIFCLINLDCPLSSSTATNQTRIINGQVSKQANWPFIAALYYGGRLRCGGTVWNEDTVVTAAHCVYKDNYDQWTSEFTIILGHADLSDWDKVDSNYVFGARRLIHHSKYIETNLKNDIAIIKLNRPIDFTGVNPRVRCVCNPVPIEQVNASACITMGWGRTVSTVDMPSDKLREVIVPLFTDKYCRSRSPAAFNSHWNICAGYKKGGKDSCIGDSGGPLVCPLLQDSTKWSLVGVVSNGKGCAVPNEPGYYTKVINFVQWINVKAGEA